MDRCPKVSLQDILRRTASDLLAGQGGEAQKQEFMLLPEMYYGSLVGRIAMRNEIMKIAGLELK